MGRVADRALEVAGKVIEFDAEKGDRQLEKLKDYEYLVRKASQENADAQTGVGNTHVWSAIGAIASGVGLKMAGFDTAANFAPTFIKELGTGIATYKQKDTKRPQTEESIDLQKMSAINEQRARAQDTASQLNQNIKTILDAEHNSKEKASRRQ